MNQKITLLCIFLMCISSVFFSTTLNANTVPSKTNTQYPSYIYFDGNFDSNIRDANSAITGSGTASDPYILENLVFNTCQQNYIQITNFNLYFEIANIEVDTPNNCLKTPSGFMFTNMTHLTLDDVSIFNYPANPFIIIKNSTDVSLIGFNSNTTANIQALNDTNINLIDSHMCFDIESTTNVFIINNTIDFATSAFYIHSFAYLNHDTHITDYNNIINGHNTNGPLIYNCSLGIIANNTVYSSSDYQLNEANNFTIFYNKAFITGKYNNLDSIGLWVYSSTNDTLLFNTVSNATDGIDVKMSNSTNYIENTFTDDSIGYYVNSSSFLLLQDNHFQNIALENYSFDQYSVNNTINNIPYTTAIPAVPEPIITILTTKSASISSTNSKSSSTTSVSSASTTSKTNPESSSNSSSISILSKNRSSPGWELGIVLLTFFSFIIRKKRKISN